MKSFKLLFLAFFLCIPLITQALTLQQTLEEILNEHPSIKERIINYQNTLVDQSIIKGGALPKVTFTGGVGFEDYRLDSVTSDTQTINNTLKTESSLIVTQNLFDGFGTENAKAAISERVKATFYNLKSTINSTMLSTVESYLNLRKGYDLLLLSQENVDTHENIHLQIRQRAESGFARRSELEQSTGRLALARSDHIVEQNSYLDAQTSFYKQVGRYLDGEQLIRPEFDFNIPATKTEALRFALKNHPQVLEGQFTVKALQYDYKGSKKAFWPTIDFELAQNWAHNTGGTVGKANTYHAMLKATYLLYSGGVDTDTVEKTRNAIYQNIALFNDLKRQITERLRLSWNAYEKKSEQVVFQEEYKTLTGKTLESYKEEFRLGRRDLFDLLNMEQEYNSARRNALSTEYEYLMAKFRVVEAMGILPEMFGFRIKEHINNAK